MTGTESWGIDGERHGIILAKNISELKVRELISAIILFTLLMSIGRLRMFISCVVVEIRSGRGGLLR